MPRKGSAYPIDQTWRDRVKEAIAAMKTPDGKQLSQNGFAKLAKVSKASLSDALSPTSKQSTCVPQIHKALGWPPPMPLLLSPDTQEMIAIWEALSDRDKGEILGRAREKAEQQTKAKR